MATPATPHITSSTPNLSQSTAEAIDRQVAITGHIAASTAETLAQNIAPFLEQVATRNIDAGTILALGVAGCVATNNFLAVQPLVKEVNTVLTAYLNELEVGSPAWSALRPVQALWFGIFKEKMNKEVFVKDGLESEFLKYPAVTTEELPNALAAMISTIETGSEEQRIKALLEVGALYYSHNRSSNELYQQAMAQVLEIVTTRPMTERETAAGIISLIHCEAALSPQQIVAIAGGGNPSIPEYVRGWHIAIADNIPEFIQAGAFPPGAPESAVVRAMYEAKVEQVRAD